MHWFQLLGGLAVLTLGAEMLVRGASALALRLGITPLVVGLTVVALGTSAPELVVCLKAALGGQADMALGNVVGSNIFNTAAILGVVAVVRPVLCQAAIVRREVPVLCGLVVVLGLLAAFLGTPQAPGASGHLTRTEGGLLVALACIYVASTLRSARGASESVKAQFAADVVPIPGESAEQLRRSAWWVNAGLVALGLLLLAGGAELLVAGAVSIAKGVGVSDLVIGLTVVSAGTSLPELATSAVAAYRGESDIALGNVVGSCIFNIVGILGLTVLIQPLDVDAVVLRRDLPVLLALTLACWLVTRSGHRISRAEGGGLLAAYVAYVVWLVLGSVGG